MTGVAIIRALTDELNRICKAEGGIRRNDPRIWDILHGLTEEEWDDILATLEALNTDSPGCYYPTDLSVLQEARSAWTKARMLGKSFVGKPMIAKSGNKYHAWRLTMIMREVVNRYNGVHIKNTPGLIEDIKDLPETPKFNELFTEQQ
jgi:hypothetical protein